MQVPPDVKPPKRRSLRLSLRTLMVVVLILAVGLGWFVRQAKVQRDAVAAIEKSGGLVFYEWQQNPNGSLNHPGQPKWPRWLVDRVGVDYFGSVTFVILGKDATDAEMEHVGRLPRLVTLNARFISGITDTRASQLAGLADLENLDLSGTEVTDAGLAHIHGLVNLKYLDLSATPVTGSGLAQLKGMNQLTCLNFEGSQLRDLKQLPALRWVLILNLSKTQVGDPDLAVLENLPSLENLNLKGTKITDAAAPQIANQINLNHLDLSQTNVSDALLDRLTRLKRLEMIDLKGTQVTTAGIARLKEALPLLDVTN